ncbi:MAG TPA: DUF2089 domain-containing protein [Chloroflexia bacterium]|nr:DUF2089 domain-containing protein [Chloroflexia bacterium]
MNPLPGRCPVCANTLTVTRLQCGHCGTGIDGAFGLGRLQALTAEQVQFVETFMKCKGKIKDVEGELGISYPTVVARLNEVVRAMGFEVDEGDLSDVDQYEYYQARVLSPQMPARPSPPATPATPAPPTPLAPFAPPAPHIPPMPGASKANSERRQQVLDDLAEGKITASEALEKINQLQKG